MDGNQMDWIANHLNHDLQKNFIQMFGFWMFAIQIPTVHGGLSLWVTMKILPGPNLRWEFWVFERKAGLRRCGSACPSWWRWERRSPCWYIRITGTWRTYCESEKKYNKDINSRLAGLNFFNQSGLFWRHCSKTGPEFNVSETGPLLMP